MHSKVFEGHWGLHFATSGRPCVCLFWRLWLHEQRYKTRQNRLTSGSSCEATPRFPHAEYSCSISKCSTLDSFELIEIFPRRESRSPYRPGRPIRVHCNSMRWACNFRFMSWFSNWRDLFSFLNSSTSLACAAAESNVGTYVKLVGDSFIAIVGNNITSAGCWEREWRFASGRGGGRCHCCFCCRYSSNHFL